MNGKTRMVRRNDLSATWGLVLQVGVATAALLCLPSIAMAQVRPLPRPVRPVPIRRPVVIQNPFVHPGLLGQAIGQAKVNVNTDHSENLARADRYAENGRYDLAAIVWQKILDGAQDVLTTSDEWYYETVDGARFGRCALLVEDIERTIAALPAEGLRAYRQHVAPQVASLLEKAETGDREAALGEIVRRFLLSSSGDDAALELAGRALDRYDFVTASQLLSRLRDRYPDSNIPAADIDVRLAAAAAHVGDQQLAELVLSQLADNRDTVSERVLALVDQEVQRLAVESPAGSWPGDAQRTILHGTELRGGHMPDVSLDAVAGPLDQLWFDDFYHDPPPQKKKSKNPGNPRVQPGIRQLHPQILRRAGIVPAQYAVSKQDMIQRWKQMNWRPTAQMLIHDGRAVFATHDRLMCRDIATGKLQWMTQPVAYQPVYPGQYNRYRQLQLQIQLQLHQRGRFRHLPQPSPQEMQFFTDRLSRSMAICGDHLIVVWPARATAARPAVNPVPFAVPQGGTVHANRLAAYALETGKLVWTRAAKGESGPAYFASAPQPVGEKLLTVIVRDDAMWLVSVDRTTGDVGWQTQLCLLPTGGRNIWSPASVAVEGNVAYVATGAGAIAAVDARWGKIQWLAVYPRGMTVQIQNAQPQVRKLAAAGVHVLDGCGEDVVIAHGSQVIVLASDCSSIFALDPRSGALQWSTPRSPHTGGAAADYCLGVLNDHLYVAGPQAVRCYDIQGGRAVWAYEGLQASGRAALTSAAIYVPGHESILCLDPSPRPMSPQQRRQQVLELAESHEEPLGNLFSDGQHLLGIGMSRVYKLGGAANSAVATSIKEQTF